MKTVIWFNWSRTAPDESVKEQHGVADDASSAGLFVLAALEGQPVVHVTFRMQARLQTAARRTGKRTRTETRKGEDVWNTGAASTG